MTTEAERLERAILDEVGAVRPCPDVLAYLYTLRGKSEDAIREALDALGEEA